MSTAGVRTKDDAPFDTAGDATWRVIPGEAEAGDLRHDDAHYDHGCVDRDLNCVFPIDRVRALAVEGRLGASRPVTSPSGLLLGDPRPGEVIGRDYAAG